jgi:hypothetical protein
MPTSPGRTTIPAWYRKLVARKFSGSQAHQGPGRPRLKRAVEQLCWDFLNKCLTFFLPWDRAYHAAVPVLTCFPLLYRRALSIEIATCGEHYASRAGSAPETLSLRRRCNPALTQSAHYEELIVGAKWPLV